MEAAKYILRYVKHTSNFGILYKNFDNYEFKEYIDADQNSCLETKRSIETYIFTLRKGPMN